MKVFDYMLLTLATVQLIIFVYGFTKIPTSFIESGDFKIYKINWVIIIFPLIVAYRVWG